MDPITITVNGVPPEKTAELVAAILKITGVAPQDITTSPSAAPAKSEEPYGTPDERRLIDEFNRAAPENKHAQCRPNWAIARTMLRDMEAYMAEDEEFSTEELMRRFRRCGHFKNPYCRNLEWLASYRREKQSGRYRYVPLYDTEKPRWLQVWENKFPNRDAEEREAVRERRFSARLMKAAEESGVPPEQIYQSWRAGNFVFLTREEAANFDERWLTGGDESETAGTAAGGEETQKTTKHKRNGKRANSGGSGRADLRPDACGGAGGAGAAD